MAKGDTGYPGVRILDTEDGYKDGGSRGTVIPHGWGENSNRRRMSEDSYHMDRSSAEKLNNYIASSLDGEIVQTKSPKEEAAEEPSPAPRRKARRQKKQEAPEEPKKELVQLTWDIPGIGTLSAYYDSVTVGEGCVAIEAGKGSQAFVPADYRNNSSAVYNIKVNGSAYKVLYSGLNFKHNESTFYILIGGRSDG